MLIDSLNMHLGLFTGIAMLGLIFIGLILIFTLLDRIFSSGENVRNKRWSVITDNVIIIIMTIALCILYNNYATNFTFKRVGFDDVRKEPISTIVSDFSLHENQAYISIKGEEYYYKTTGKHHREILFQKKIDPAASLEYIEKISMYI